MLFFTHKGSGECAGVSTRVSTCDRTHQMVKNACEFRTPAISKMEFFVAILNFQFLSFVLKISTLNDATRVLDHLEN